MAAPTAITELSQTAGSNGPDGASVSPIEIDNYQRAHAAFIAQLRDGKGNAATTSVASATTTDIGAANSHAVEITGTTTITGFGTAYSGVRLIRFAGVLTLTHSSALALPGAANITTAAGDTCIAVPNLAANGWNVFAYQRSGWLYAKSGANTDITSLAGPAIGAATATTPAASATGTEVVTAQWVNINISRPLVMAYQSGTGATAVHATFTKVSFSTERYDTNGRFASSTFTPDVPGYYQISACVQLASSAPGFITIYKNGGEYKRGAWSTLSLSSQAYSVSGLVEMNGTTDFVEIYIYQTSGGPIDTGGGISVCWFDAHFARV